MPETDRNIVNYTVLTDAIVLATDETDPQTKKPVVVRATKGQTFDAYDDDPRVLTFRAMKSIRPTKDATGKERITALTILRAFQTDEADPVNIVEDVKPIDAPAPVDPNALLASSLS